MEFHRLTSATMRLLIPIVSVLTGGCTLEKLGCNSTGVLNIESFSERGEMVVALRQGTRPGSKLIDAGNVTVGNKLSFSKICPGTYFFSFGRPDSDTVFVTEYQEVKGNTKRFETTVRLVRGSSSNPPKRISATAM